MDKFFGGLTASLAAVAMAGCSLTADTTTAFWTARPLSGGDYAFAGTPSTQFGFQTANLPIATGNSIMPAFASTAPAAATPAGLPHAASNATIDATPVLEQDTVIAEIQQLLTSLNFGVGPADGRLTLTTSEAIAAYQKRRNLAADGRPSGPLLAQLRAEVYPRAAKAMGPVRTVGAGATWSYIEFAPDGRPIAVGSVFSEALLADLPPAALSPQQCVDANLDMMVAPMAECVTTREVLLPLPEVTLNNELPVDWISAGWLPFGRQNRGTANQLSAAARWPAAWSQPHISVHFFLPDMRAARASGIGSCGDLIDCAAFQRATVDLPPLYAPPNHVNVGAASPFYGNHLIDQTAPAVITGDVDDFRHGFNYGSFDGRLAFFEVLATPEFLRKRQDSCFAISQPPAVARPGFYPTAYCIRERPEVDGVSVSLEGLVARTGHAALTAQR